jgi:hypothetical protein
MKASLTSTLRAQIVDWDRPMDEAAIAARLDALDLQDVEQRQMVVETLDVLAEELVGRAGHLDADLKARIQALRRAVLAAGGLAASGAFDPGEVSGPSGTVGHRESPDREGQP